MKCKKCFLYYFFKIIKKYKKLYIKLIMVLFVKVYVVRKLRDIRVLVSDDIFL